MFKVSPVSLQTFIDTPNCILEDRVQYSTVHIMNVLRDDYLQIISCVGIVILRCTETFYSLCKGTISVHYTLWDSIYLQNVRKTL